MSNITIATICLALFSICAVLGWTGLLISEFVNNRDKEILDALVEKLKELKNTPSCGPCVDKMVSIRWLLDYIERLRK